MRAAGAFSQYDTEMPYCFVHRLAVLAFIRRRMAHLR